MVGRSTASEAELVEALRRGDEQAFVALVRQLHPSLVRLARLYVPASIAEEVVQEAWISVIENLDSFEERSSLKTWVTRIMLNKARTRSVREARIVPLAGAGPAQGPSRPAVDPDDLLHPEMGGAYWPAAPARWDTLPEERLLGREVAGCIRSAMTRLPVAQHEVVLLRDVEGWEAEEVCHALGISAVNQRVLLHRGRSAIRRALEEYLHD